MRRVSSVLVFLAALLALASCGKAAEKISEKAIEQSAGGDVDIDDDGSFSFENDDGSLSVDKDGNVKIEGDDGEFSIDSNAEGELPDDFPDIPLPDDFAPQSNSKQSDGETTVYSAFGTSEGVPEDILGDLITRYESAGYEVTARHENTIDGEFSGGAQFLGSKYNVTMAVFGNDDETTVSLTVTPAEG